MSKIVAVNEAVAQIKDGMTIMCSGFLGQGGANKVLLALSKTGVKDLTVICNDGSKPGLGLGLLITNGQVKKLIASHIGLNPEVGKKMNAGELEVTLVPQGSLAEKIRAGGAGLGGILTPTGFGTIVAEGKQTITVDGKNYLLETPLHADVSLINGYKVDKSGNVWYRGTARNFNVVMATAADTVIVEADHVVEIGEIEPENVVTPGILVDYIVDGGKI
ncbi:MAG: CoA transferase subunit A [Clostridia bacterium]|nr:CoA transferase subunit A [Clostridia bacterium]